MTGRLWERRDHYDLLEVERDATAEELQAAYRLQAKVWHPDRLGPELAAQTQERFTRIKDAYDVLKDAKRRAKYDLLLPSEEEASGTWSVAEQNSSSVWKQLAVWMKEHDVGAGFHRKMAFAAGDALERRRELSEKQKPYAQEAWDMGVAAGWKPGASD